MSAEETDAIMARLERFLDQHPGSEHRFRRRGEDGFEWTIEEGQMAAIGRGATIPAAIRKALDGAGAK